MHLSTYPATMMSNAPTKGANKVTRIHEKVYAHRHYSRISGTIQSWTTQVVIIGVAPPLSDVINATIRCVSIIIPISNDSYRRLCLLGARWISNE